MGSLMKKSFDILLIPLFLLLLSCAPTVPINVSGKNFPDFGVKEITSSMKPETVLGKRYFGKFIISIGKPDLYYASDIKPENFQTFTKVVREELTDAGYKTLFQIDDVGKSEARFLISGTILAMKYNSWVAMGGARYAYDAAVTVRWEVYDQQKKKIIYSKKTSGSAKDKEMDEFKSGDSSLMFAFRRCFRELLVSNDLVDSIVKQL